MIDKLKTLKINEKLKVALSTDLFPEWLNTSVNIDDEWCERVSKNITEEQLDEILSK